MPQIFLSYRRNELPPHLVGRVYDALSTKFGEHSVFQDLYSIPPATDFAKRIPEAVLESKVLIALIGRNWVRIGAGRKRRIVGDDWVSTELLIAQTMKTPIIPVLVDRAPKLKAEALPAQLVGLANIQAISLGSEETFHGDMEQLIKATSQYLKPTQETGRSQTSKPATTLTNSFDEAHAKLDPASSDSTDWRLHFSRGVAYANLRGGTETNNAALRAYNYAIAFAPDDLEDYRRARLFNYRGAIYKRLGSPKEAKADLEYALSLTSDRDENLDSRYNLAGVYAQLQRKSDMLSMISQLRGSSTYMHTIEVHRADHFSAYKDDPDFLRAIRNA